MTVAGTAPLPPSPAINSLVALNAEGTDLFAVDVRSGSAVSMGALVHAVPGTALRAVAVNPHDGRMYGVAYNASGAATLVMVGRGNVLAAITVQPFDGRLQGACRVCFIERIEHLWQWSGVCLRERV